MDMRWLTRAYQFDDEPAGGGEPKPVDDSGSESDAGEAEVRDEDSEYISHPLETLADEVEEDVDLGDTEEEVPPISLPEDFVTMFSPPAQPQPPAVSPPAAPSAPAAPQEGLAGVSPPPQVDFPSEDEWFEDAGKAAQKQAAAIAWNTWKAQEPMRRAIEEIRGHRTQEERAAYYEKVQEVQQAAQDAREALANYYSEKGPLNSDKEFRNNPELQASVKVILGECTRRALAIADQTGDTTPLRRMTADPKFIPRLLALAKADTVQPDPGFKPKVTPAGKQAGVASKRDGLTPEQRKALAAARADGHPYTADELRKAAKAVKETIY